MHRPIFGGRNEEDDSTRKKQKRNEEDADTGAPGSLTAPAEANSGGSSSSPIETDNVASSSSTESTGNCYEVFLSFRGPDTRHGFTDHLYHGLRRVGINAFRDDDELCQGEDIRPKLMAAITNSKILIPIFSESYGTSSWCLDELVEIMERKNNNGQIVLPIFYKVKPSDVGHQIGSFGRLFHEREGRLLERSSQDLANLKKWKKALGEVREVKGYEADGYEANLVKSIVRKVLSELKKKFELHISENLVGIDPHVKKVMEFVDNKSHATLFVGIHGMGGIGKTTLAKAIYNELSNQFDHRSFIADIRESWKHNGVRYLQNQLIYDILKRENEVRGEDEGTTLISSRFKHKKVLILLDDVDDVAQVKCLAGNRDWFSSGSKILITTRDEMIFKKVGVDYVYDHKEMDNNQALILFSKHAFRRDSPPSEFKDLADEAISITGGLPLSLEVLGSSLCGGELSFWRGTIDKFKKVPPTKVREKLMISYEVLDDGQKQIFLDIACFFIGTDRRIASYMWDACGFFPKEGIEVLRFMSLIKIGDDHKLRMADQLRDLGREIVREENQRVLEERSRLWDFEEVQKVLKLNKGTEEIEAIDLSKGSSDGDTYIDKQFKKLKRLRFLHMMKGAHLSGDFKDSIKELKWLRWENCPMNLQLKNFHATELVVLELSGSKINERWLGWSSFKMATKLKFLDLTSCLSLENTHFLSAFKKLEVLILNSCRGLQQIDSSIGDMKALLRLELISCRSLLELPAEIGKLEALEQLLLEDTQKLSVLPDSIGSLQNLEILTISGSGIKELPNSIGRLRKLRHLDVSRWNKLGGVMLESIGSLAEIQDLNMLKSLEMLNIEGRTSIKRLYFLESRKLKKLKAGGCKNLIEIQGLDMLEFLEMLNIEGCTSIKGLKLPKSGRLKELKAGGCANLADIQDLDTLEFLEMLNIEGCTSIKRLELSKSKRLKKLKAGGCKNLTEIQGLDMLESLEMLIIEGCSSIEGLKLPKSGRLKELKAGGCENLTEIQGLDMLESLQMLIIEGCSSIEGLKLPKSGRLKELKAGGCKNLAEIQDLDTLEFLEMLNIEGCTSIERLDLPKSGRLKTVKT